MKRILFFMLALTFIFSVSVSAPLQTWILILVFRHRLCHPLLQSRKRPRLLNPK